MAMPRKWPYGYYSYTLCYPNGVPYYAGAGRGARAKAHAKNFNGYCPEKEIRRTGRTSIRIITEHAGKEEAFAHEKATILRYGRRDIGTGILFNLTDGRGSAGKIWTTEQREAIGAGQRGRKHSLEQRQALSLRLMGNQHLLGHHPTLETRQKISNSLSETYEKNLREFGRKVNITEEDRIQRGERLKENNKTNPPRKGKKCSSEHRRKLSEAKKRYYALKRAQQCTP